MDTFYGGQGSSELRFYDSNEKCSKDVVIPSVSNTNLRITSIYKNTFKGKAITSAVIPGAIPLIGESAFADNQISNLIIFNGVKTIGRYSFQNNLISNVNIPNSIENIGTNAFNNNKITSVIIPSSVKVIEDGAFINNPLTNVTIEGDSNRFNDRWEAIGFPTRLESAESR
mgnify:CR=1 FL=1